MGIQEVKMSYDNTATGVPALSANTPFFGLFPSMDYDINNTLTYKVGTHDTVTDIFFRFGFIKKVISQIAAYYVYDVLDTDSPELLAERLYGDAGAGWIIIYANKISDPQFDWPLNYDAFQKMIISKYGSVEWAQTNTHHCEMTITRTNQFYNTTQTTSFIIDNERQTNVFPNVPYTYFTPWTATTHRTSDSNIFSADNEQLPYMTADLTYDDAVTVSRSGSIPTVQADETFEIDGKTVTVNTSGRKVSYFEYEIKINDDKRPIKIIKPEYYPRIMDEFKILTKKQPNYLRGFA